VTNNIKISIALVFALLAVVAGVVVINGDDESSTATSQPDQLVRPDSQRLSTGSTDATFVEFLDFECEACAAAFPAVEETRRIYGDRVTFVVRYMPLHASSVNAAKAAEAAAAQGKFEAMYSKLFETQLEWGEQRTPEQQKFFTYAEQLGLDMTKFKAVYDDPATEAKVNRDKADGRALGVTGTPTFFLDGQKFAPPSLDDFKSKFDQAIAR
jgi:protein-disulfide isomerase